MRNLVERAGRTMVNGVRKRGQLSVCTGGCRGHVERGHARVPAKTLHTGWQRRRLRDAVHLTIGGCLGPCAPAHVCRPVALDRTPPTARARVFTMKVIVATRRHRYTGALEPAATVDHVFGQDATSAILEHWVYEPAPKAHLRHAEVRAFVPARSTWACRDMAAWMLEAMSRGRCRNPDPDPPRQLEHELLDAAARHEARGDVPPARGRR